jgi:hypothetical protein
MSASSAAAHPTHFSLSRDRAALVASPAAKSRERVRVRGAPPFGAHAAALATGCYPDGSASEPGIPRLSAQGVGRKCCGRKECFARRAEQPNERKTTAVKHAPCRPVLMPVDRGSEAARVRIGNSARGDRTSLRCYGMPSGTAPLVSEVYGYY